MAPPIHARIFSTASAWGLCCCVLWTRDVWRGSMSGGRRRAWTLGMAALLWLSARAPVAPQARPGTVAQPEPLLVAAARRWKSAFNEIGDAFEAETGQPVTFVFGASGNLATQIENGAPFDVFAAANVEFVERLADGGLILPDTQAVYAQGRLALAVNRGGRDGNQPGRPAGPRHHAWRSPIPNWRPTAWRSRPCTAAGCGNHSAQDRLWRECAPGAAIRADRRRPSRSRRPSPSSPCRRFPIP